jgi:glycosyltransferase involved in cell wall biosynthesis
MWKNYWLYYLAMFRVQHVITVSTFTRKRLTRHFPATAGRVSVIPPGVSERFFTPRDVRENVPGKIPTFLTVTRLDEQDRIKNVHGVIEALADLKQEYAFRYRVISGSQHGNYRQELENLIHDHGLEDAVSIEGRKSDQELVEIYTEADLFILVSYAEPENFEGFGIVFLEANASGIPVLSSREGGMADYIVENDNGFYVEDPSAAGIRAALKRYLDGEISFDPDSIRRFPDPFRWTSITDRIIGVYDEHGTHA